MNKENLNKANEAYQNMVRCQSRYEYAKSAYEMYREFHICKRDSHDAEIELQPEDMRSIIAMAIGTLERRYLDAKKEFEEI